MNFVHWFLLAFQFALLIWLTVLVFRHSSLKNQVADLRIRLSLSQREQEARYQLLLDQIRQKENRSNALEALQHIFGDKIEQIRLQYPALTILDAQVLILIALGVENHEILAFTNMSKRTYYKRRQLIAQRMNTTAAQLDNLAKQVFTTNI